jgi:hypothetical protein
MGKENMKKKILIISITAAVLLVIASFSSVIGTNNEKSAENAESPLFAIRTQRSIGTEEQQSVRAQYLGKGASSTLFRTTKPTLSTAIDRTIKLLNQNPAFFARFIETLCKNPRVISLLHENGISMAEFKTQLNYMKNDPSLFINEIQSVQERLDKKNLDTPLPLGLNTTSVIGCVVTVIALLPVVLIIGMIVVLFTLRILQCLKLNEVMQNIMDQIVEELFPPGYNI